MAKSDEMLKMTKFMMMRLETLHGRIQRPNRFAHAEEVEKSKKAGKLTTRQYSGRKSHATLQCWGYRENSPFPKTYKEAGRPTQDLTDCSKIYFHRDREKVWINARKLRENGNWHCRKNSRRD